MTVGREGDTVDIGGVTAELFQRFPCTVPQVFNDEYLARDFGFSKQVPLVVVGTITLLQTVGMHRKLIFPDIRLFSLS